MKQITSQEAVQLSKLGDQKAPIKKPPEKLIEAINKRIQLACEYGKFFTMLNSLNYNGNGVRGIGVYLSNGEIASIEHYYKEFGFTVGRQYDPKNPLTLTQVWIQWKEQENKGLVCEDCGCSDETVVETICPYAQDIDGQEVEVTLCTSCHNERAADI